MIRERELVEKVIALTGEGRLQWENNGNRARAKLKSMVIEFCFYTKSMVIGEQWKKPDPATYAKIILEIGGVEVTEENLAKAESVVKESEAGQDYRGPQVFSVESIQFNEDDIKRLCAAAGWQLSKKDNWMEKAAAEHRHLLEELKSIRIEACLEELGQL